MVSSGIRVKWEVSHIFFCVVRTKKVIFHDIIGPNAEMFHVNLNLLSWDLSQL